MTTSISLHSRTLTQGLLTTMAFAIVGCTQSGAAEPTQLASIAVRSPTPIATPARASDCTHLETGRVLSLVTPDGERTQLTYFRGCGWKYRASTFSAA